MKMTWSANTWVALVLGAIVLITAIDLGRRAVMGDQKSKIGASTALGGGVPVGETAPEFTLPDNRGNQVSLSKLVKGDTILGFYCGCNNCRSIVTYLGELKKKMSARKVDFIGVVTFKPDYEKAWIRDTGLHEKLLYDSKATAVMDIYEGHPCPRVYRIDANRKIEWVSPSPRDLPLMPEFGRLIASDLGFSSPGNPKSGPQAPPFPDEKPGIPGTSPLGMTPPAGAEKPFKPMRKKAPEKEDPNVPPYARQGVPFNY
jgi:peroxiredoxin